ncbi:FAST kinase domain-containing protein 3, mitochondrial-like [Haliotis cracherodii]|uniref:FAST kinase domain-containing protein 3, mitochondrial-like n=1 Tax=Haliotis cracherodii TaxID=6455 RepID=UPI0039EC7984
MACSMTQRLGCRFAYIKKHMVFRRQKLSPAVCSSCFSTDNSSEQQAASNHPVSVSMRLLYDEFNNQKLPFRNHLQDSKIYSMNHGRHSASTTEKEKVRISLKQCRSVTDVFHKLDIPTDGHDDKLGGLASQALLRICSLQEDEEARSSLSESEPFLSNTLMDELYDMAGRDLTSLPNSTLLSLGKTFLQFENTKHQFSESLIDDMKRRIVELQFSMTDLLTLGYVLKRNEKYQELVSLIWFHIGKSCSNIDVSPILGTPSQSNVCIMELMILWITLNTSSTSEEMVFILNSLVRLNVSNRRILESFSRFISKTFVNTKDTDIMQIVHAYNHFHHSDRIIMEALENYVVSHGSCLTTSLLALVMEHCYVSRTLSPLIFDKAATHFSENGHTYNPLQIYLILRPFGHLNYFPQPRHKFVSEAETVILKQFFNFEAHHVIELVCTFAFQANFSRNFALKVFTPYFFGKLAQLDSEQRRQASEYLLMFKTAVITETNIWKEVMSQPHGSMMAGTVSELQHSWDTPLVNKQSSEMCQALESLLGQNGFRMNWAPRSSAFMMDIVVHVKDGRPVEIQEEVDCDKRLGLLIRRPEHYRIRHNSHPRLLGKYVMMKRHLLRSGYTVLEVSGEAVDRNSNLVEYFRRLLQPYLVFGEEQGEAGTTVLNE